MSYIDDSALHVQPGIEQPVSVSPYLKKKRKREFTVDQYVEAILKGDVVMLSKAITCIESTAPEHIEFSKEMLQKLLPYSGNSLRVGITGVPGVGKSTFIESLGMYLDEKGHKLAVLAVDPSSERSKGSILGDKTRMVELSTKPNAFIRPSPSGLTLGGVARKTRETIILCEAAGYDIILVETVGVGQSETIVKSMVDFFLLLMLAGAGDDLQGIKRGIMEMANALIITKADGDNKIKATAAQALYKSAMQLLPRCESGWIPKVDTCSAVDGYNIERVWNIVTDFEKFTKENHFFDQQRSHQLVQIFYETIDATLKDRFYSNEIIEKKIEELLPQIRSHIVTPYQAAESILSLRSLNG